MIATLKFDEYDYCFYYYIRYVCVYQTIVFFVENQNEQLVLNEIIDRIILSPNQKRSAQSLAEKRKKSAHEQK